VYWYRPILIWMNAHYWIPKWEEVGEGGVHVLPGEVRPFFEASERAFTGLGFSQAAVLAAEDPLLNHMRWAAIFVDRAERTRALALAYTPLNPLATTRIKPFVYFNTRFTDGRVVETSNSGLGDLIPPRPGRDSWRFPKVEAPELLCKIHRLRLPALGDAPREFPAQGKEVAFQTKTSVEFYEWLVETGHVVEVEPGRLYRPTLKGAYRFWCRMIPPLSWIIRLRKWGKIHAFLTEHQLWTR
jgi:hypothetical protein